MTKVKKMLHISIASNVPGATIIETSGGFKDPITI